MFTSELGGEVDPYFQLSVCNPLAGWRRQWFFLKNDIDAPLPAVMGRRLVAQPNWGYRVAKKDIHKLWPVLDVLKSLSWMELPSMSWLKWG
jgi:hypothetical protein